SRSATLALTEAIKSLSNVSGREADVQLLSFAGQWVPTKPGNIKETYLLNPVNLSAKTKEQFFKIRCVSCS
ncbi:hypothetical protein, partial [Pseudomonas cerasi]